MRTVSVACKIANGLRIADDVVLAGPGVGPPQFDFVAGKVKTSDKEIVAGYALTHGVNAEVYEKWLEANKDSDIISKRLVVADASPVVLRARVSVLGSTKSGFEQAKRD